MTDIIDRLKRRITPMVGHVGWGSVETEHGLIQDAIAEIERLRSALKRISKGGVGLQGIIEDYGHDTNAYNYHAMKYWYLEVSRQRAIAIAALEQHDKHPDEIQTSNK